MLEGILEGWSILFEVVVFITGLMSVDCFTVGGLSWRLARTHGPIKMSGIQQ